MVQIHMGRANPFRALVAGLTADEFLLLREAVDERRCREEVETLQMYNRERPYRSLVLAQCRFDWQSNPLSVVTVYVEVLAQSRSDW